MAVKSKFSECDVIIAAAGASKRFGGRTKKQYHKIDGIPVVVHTVLRMMRHFRSENIIIAAPLKGSAEMFRILAEYSVEGVRIVEGGDERAISVMNALQECRRKFVMIHDGARPFIPDAMIKRIISADLHKNSCIVPFVKPHETVRSTVNNRVKTVDRNTLMLIQTPQMFFTESIKKAMADFLKHKQYFTDDAEYILRSGGRIEFVEGDRRNMKITAKEDAKIMSMLMKAEV